MNTENNKSIAEFLKLSKNLHLYEHPLTGEYVDLEDLNFDSDWNLLMEVVENIERLGYKSCIENWFCCFDGNSEETEHLYFENMNGETTKIDAVYNTCLDVIKWHNEQKQ